MNTALLNKISEKKLSRMSVQEIDEATKALDDAVNEFLALPTEEEQISQANVRYGFLQNSLLHLAAKFGDDEAGGRILEVVAGNAEIVNSRNSGMFTPLHYAAHSGNPMLTQYLLEAGAENNPQASAENRCWTPIHYAAQFGHAAVVQALIDHGVDKETRTGFGLTPLVIAAEFGQLEVLRFLLGAGADRNVQTIEDNHRMTALHYAAVGNFKDVLLTLLKSGVKRNQTTNDGLDALDLAIQADAPDSVAVLLTWGVGDLDHAFRFATEMKSTKSLEKIKDYLSARKELFDLKQLKGFSSELVATLKKCSRANLGEIEFSPSLLASFNIYGLLALKRKTGLITKKDESLIQFCINNKVMDVVSTMRAVEQMMPKS